MKKTSKKVVCVFCATMMLAVSGIAFMSFMPGDDVMTKEGNTTIVNTTQLGKNVKGFQGATPVRVFIQKDKVVRIETLPNKETSKFFSRAKTLLAKFEGRSVKKAAKMKVDGVTGATFSSEALKKNVELALKYYQQHK